MVDYARAKKSFTQIYDDAVWGHGSGASAPEATRAYMKLLRSFVRDNEVRSIVDVGCGDWQFSRDMDWSNLTYHGFDVVESVVDENRRSFASDTIRFDVLGSMDDLPPADLVVCKDVLQHLPNEDVLAYLRLFASRYKYALITNDVHAIEKSEGGSAALDNSWINRETHHGGWRRLHIDKPPFGLKIAVLLQWDIDGATWCWTKSTCLLMQPPSPIGDDRRGFLFRKTR